MSHLTTLQVEIDDMNAVKETLKELGYEVREEEQKHTINSRWGWKLNADVSATKNDKQMPIGFIQNEETGKIEVQADWFDMDMNQKQFQDELNRLHAKHKTINEVKKRGWKVADIKEDNEGNITIDASRWT